MRREWGEEGEGPVRRERGCGEEGEGPVRRERGR